MAARKDITGQRFGRLIAIGDDPRGTKGGSRVWRMKCDCGRETFKSLASLGTGRVLSCGCLARECRRGTGMRSARGLGLLP